METAKQTGFSKAFKLGWNACNAGKMLLSNPFATENDEIQYNEWKSGWQTCQHAWNSCDRYARPVSFK